MIQDARSHEIKKCRASPTATINIYNRCIKLVFLSASELFGCSDISRLVSKQGADILLA
jgi:hypothetical protein